MRPTMLLAASNGVVWNCCGMSDKLYQIRFKVPELSPQPVVAAKAEVHCEHLVLLNANGKVAALFLMEMIESFAEADL